MLLCSFKPPVIPNNSKTITNLFISSFVSCLYLYCLYIAFLFFFLFSTCAIVVTSKNNSNREMADVSVLGGRWGPGLQLGLNIGALTN